MTHFLLIYTTSATLFLVTFLVTVYQEHEQAKQYCMQQNCLKIPELYFWSFLKLFEHILYLMICTHSLRHKESQIILPKSFYSLT